MGSEDEVPLICTEYSKFMSELLIDFDGEKLPLSVVRGKLSDKSSDPINPEGEA